MDSGGNSGSLQSSSGDEEYDSRAADSFSVFMNHPSLHQPAPPQSFDPVANYLQLQNSSPLSPFWPRSTDLGSEAYNSTITSAPFMSNFHPPSTVSGDSHNVAPPAAGADSQAQNQNPAARNPKKRSRASRRAPTTVLTTDTSNFRAMVQEFTGIPAPPFTSSSPFQRNRLDLFGTSSTLRFPDPAQPPFLRRPFSQADVQSSPPPPLQQPFLSSTPASTQSSNLFPNINPMNPFLQSNHKFPFSSSLLKTQDSFQNPSNENPNIKLREIDHGFSLGDGNVSATTLSTLPNLVSSDQIPTRTDPGNESTSTDRDNESWRNNVVNPDDEQLSAMRLVNGNYSFTRNLRNSKMNNYSASSSSQFHEEKGQENTPTRSEGMMEPWIVSSE